MVGIPRVSTGVDDFSRGAEGKRVLRRKIPKLHLALSRKVRLSAANDIEVVLRVHTQTLGFADSRFLLRTNNEASYGSVVGPTR